MFWNGPENQPESYFQWVKVFRERISLWNEILLDRLQAAFFKISKDFSWNQFLVHFT